MISAERKAVIQYRIEKAEALAEEIETHLENEFWGTAINRMYYAAYHGVSAWLLSLEVSTQTHAGVRRMLGLHGVRTGEIPTELGRFYSILFDKRQVGDYDDFVVHDPEEIKAMLPKLKALLLRIKTLLRVSDWL